MQQHYDKLIAILREMFQMDQADLDFGIYRIMNQKKDELENFFQNDLLPQVHTEFDNYKDTKIEDKKRELQELEDTLRKVKVEPDNNEEVQKLRAEIHNSADTESLAGEVFSHLATFFRRYYDGGDFLSLRRYKKDTYAIPYEGEEVKLHWANHDQYYIKSSAYLRDYTFKIAGNKRIHFKLVDATQEKDNVKETNGKERRFQLYQEEPFKIDGTELFIQFVYLIDKEKQDKHNTKTIEYLNSKIGSLSDFQDIFTPQPTPKNKNRTLLEKHLETYTARFNFDFFIHKDLGGFLRRELDFYIKNEILFIDDLDHHDIQKLKISVAKIKVMKNIAHKIIDMLAQLEDFQKTLWLKKKFVTNCGYCVTLDRVQEALYPQIAENSAQREEWIHLFAIDEIIGNPPKIDYSNPLTVGFLKANPFLVLDTKHFSKEFTETLLKSFEDIDEQCDGVIINSENFQALGLLQEKYREKIKCVYIDPPYNSKSSEIIYKNSYKHSSWASLMNDRIALGKTFLKDQGVNTIAIDENEQEILGQVIQRSFNEYKKTCVSIIHNPGGIQGTNFSYTHEFAYFLFPNVPNIIQRVKREESNIESLRDWGGAESLRQTARNCFYPIIVNTDNEILDFGDVCDDSFHPNNANIVLTNGNISIYPIDDNGIERKWRYARQSIQQIKHQLICKERNGIKYIQNEKSFFRLKTVWFDKKYNANVYGSKLLNNIILNNPFDFPKSIYTVRDSIFASSNKNSNILDYFAGSGTTGHAVINLNREDNGNRKYILVEMGQYFDTVLKPRIQKVIYSKDWKDGKPVSREGSSHLFKYMKLESYEDTLDNLTVKRSNKQELALQTSSAAAKEGYMLRYFLDVETRRSDSLLNIDKFADPFNYTLKIRQDDELQEQKIDLVETFNYLIGLYVQQTEVIRGFKVIRGRLRTGEKTLVIWRNTHEKDNESLNEFFKTLTINPLDFEYQRIYVNGDNTLENLKVAEDTWKVVMIEEEFKKRMFDVQDI